MDESAVHCNLLLQDPEICYCQTQKTVNTWKISGMLIVYWPITIKFRTHEQTSKPQTNYRCCLRFSSLLANFSQHNNKFHKYFWCWRFCEFYSKISLCIQNPDKNIFKIRQSVQLFTPLLIYKWPALVTTSTINSNLNCDSFVAFTATIHQVVFSVFSVLATAKIQSTYYA